ncbi:protein kinase [Perkinsus sp. BL_2016]|nr:protein kinase [Perkinsus sp. BL_2016]
MRSASVGLLSAGPTMPPSTYGSSSQGINLHHNGGSTAIPSSSMQPQIPSPPEIIVDPRPIAGRPSGRRYLRGKILGKGGFAKCYEATDLDTRELWAVKIVAKASLVKQRAKVKLLSEIAIHKTLFHEKVVRYVNHFDDADFVYIIMELCPNQTLNDLLKKKRRFTEPETLFYIYELVQGLMYLRKERVIHRDLKLGNLFLGADMELKIGDFGLAAKLEYEDERRTTICGTPNYIAPEILDNHHKGHSFQVDVWSLGVVMFTMLVGKPPFEDVDVKSTYQRIRDNAYAFPETLFISSSAKSLIQSILRHDPKSRPTIGEILRHPWFSSNQSPPALPASIQAMNRATGSLASAQTPRTAATVMRSETPINENIHNRDFARIDSPNMFAANRQPLRSTNAQFTSTAGGSRSRQSSNDENRYQQRQAPTIMTAAASPGLRPPMAPLRSSNQNLQQAVQMARKQAQTYGAGSPFEDTARPSGGLAHAQSPQVANPEEMFAPRLLGGKSSLPEAWIVRWIDYSSKYGIGYQLSTGRIGVYFNDATKMVFGNNSRSVEYLFRHKGDKSDTVNVISLDDESLGGDAKKKTTLIRNFKGYLQTNTEKEGCTRGLSTFSIFPDTSDPVVSSTSLPLHLKRWMRTKHALVFQLSNKVWQVIFQDRTEVILSATSHLCHYMSPMNGGGHSSVSVYPLGSIGDVADEYVAKRLAYSKQVVIHMLGGSSGSGGAPPPE